MDYDDYESLNDEFKIVNNTSRQNHFFTANEIVKDATISKAELSHDEIVGDPSRTKAIKNSRPAVYDIHTATSSNGTRINRNQQPSNNRVSQVDYRICPICSGPAVGMCRCNNRDSVCANSHKWHFRDGKIIMGHSH